MICDKYSKIFVCFFLYVITNSMFVKRVQEIELSVVVCSNERFVEGEKMSKVRGTGGYSRFLHGFFMVRQSAEKASERPSRYNILCIWQRFLNFFEFRVIIVK